MNTLLKELISWKIRIAKKYLDAHHFLNRKDPQQARLRSLGFINNDLSQLYKATGNRTKEKETLYHALRIGESIPNSAVIALVSANLSQCYYALNQLDSSLFWPQKYTTNEHFKL